MPIYCMNYYFPQWRGFIPVFTNLRYKTVIVATGSFGESMMS